MPSILEESLPFRPGSQSVKIRYIKYFSGHLVRAVLSYQLVQPILAAANGDDENATRNHTLGEGLADPGGCAGDENILIWERHRCYVLAMSEV